MPEYAVQTLPMELLKSVPQQMVCELALESLSECLSYWDHSRHLHLCITLPAAPGQLHLSLCPNFLAKTTLCCSLHMAPSAASRSGCSCSTCTHGHRATFVTLAPMPSPDCLADLPGSFCTAARKPDFPVLLQYFIQATHLPHAFQAYCPCFLRATSDSAACSASL